MATKKKASVKKTTRRVKARAKTVAPPSRTRKKKTPKATRKKPAARANKKVRAPASRKKKSAARVTPKAEPKTSATRRRAGKTTSQRKPKAVRQVRPAKQGSLVRDNASGQKVTHVQTVTFAQDVFFPVPPEVVFQALVAPEQQSRFTGGTATGDGRPGAPFTAWNGYITGRYLAIEQNRSIVAEWSTTEWPQGTPPSLLDIQMHPVDGGTALTLTHSALPPEQAEHARQLWIDFYWIPLQQHLLRCSH